MEYVVIVGVIVFVGAMLYARRARQNDMLQRARRVIALADRFRASDDGEYFTASALRRLEQELGEALNERLRRHEVSLLADTAVQEQVREAQKVLDDRRGAVDRYNRDFVERRLNETASWFDKRATRLTPEQRRAVVTDEDATLVIAAAGSGKTATIVAKAEYLVWRKRARPEQICLLAFNKSAADEIRERLQQVGLDQVQVSTFHGLGYAVHGSALGTRNPVSNLTESGPLDELLQKALRGLLNDDTYFSQLAQWFWDKRVTADMLQDARTPHARLQRERNLGLKTLTGVWVRSQAEVKLADWMTLNGVEWSYETPYPHGPDDPNRRRYQPDFFLPEYDLWMELWALNRAGETSTGIDAKKYRKDMEWKRSLHREYRTSLVEVWQDEVWSGKLDPYMRSQLAQRSVALKRISPDRLLQLLAERNQAAITGLPALMAAFLKLHRGGLWTHEELQGRVRNERDRAFLNVYLPVYKVYEDTLRSRGEIDFDDMLGGAVDLLKQVQSHRYRYVLVDEFQDTSRSRMAFARALRQVTPDARLFLVGDDWQSINRFAGSDLALFTKVEKELGFTARVTLGTTFRLLPDVTAISSRFVMQNPAQLAKAVRTPKSALDELGVVLHGYQDDNWISSLREVLNLIVARKKQGSSVLVLSRYRHYLEQEELKALVKEYRAKELNMDLTTVHSSKGLEAEHVIVLNVNSGIRSFPNGMEDDPVLQLVSAAPDEFEFAEERRLMYVALTRSRGRVYLLHSSAQPSVFIEELLEREADHIEKLGHISVRLPCPNCGGRTIHRREGQYGQFWGCTNFPNCDGRLIACDRCREGALVLNNDKTLQCNHCKATIERCPRCNDGHLIMRTNRSAGTTFWGCSGWRPNKQGCEYTRSH